MIYQSINGVTLWLYGLLYKLTLKPAVLDPRGLCMWGFSFEISRLQFAFPSTSLPGNILLVLLCHFSSLGLSSSVCACVRAEAGHQLRQSSFMARHPLCFSLKINVYMCICVWVHTIMCMHVYMCVGHGVVWTDIRRQFS